MKKSLIVLLLATCYLPQIYTGPFPLHKASAYGNTNRIAHLLRLGCDIYAPDRQGATPLHLAAENGQTQVLYLLANQARHNENPLDENARSLAKLLNARDENLATPLHWATLMGHMAMVNILLEYGADQYAVDKNGQTPLDIAADKGFRNSILHQHIHAALRAANHRQVLSLSRTFIAPQPIRPTLTTQARELIHQCAQK